MALITLLSVSGAPGTTTTALGLTLAWDRPAVLIEADTTGTSAILSGYLRGIVPFSHGLLDLAAAHRRNQLLEALHANSMPLTQTGARLIPSLARPASNDQVRLLNELWGPLGAAAASLDRAGTDVIVDAGRFGATGAPLALLAATDQVLIVTRTTLPAIAATRAVGTTVRDALEKAGNADAVGLILVGEGQPYSTSEIVKFARLPVTTSVAWDPVHAEVFSVGAEPSRKFNQSSLIRSLRAASSAIATSIGRRQQRLTPGVNVLETITQEGRSHAN